jgi:hypothetical protein
MEVEVRLMIYTVKPAVRNRVIAVVRAQSPRPTELLDILQKDFSYRDVQDALSELLDDQQIMLDSKRHLKLVAAAA